MIQVLNISTVSEFREWLAANGFTANECWIAVLSGRADCRDSIPTQWTKKETA